MLINWLVLLTFETGPGGRVGGRNALCGAGLQRGCCILLHNQPNEIYTDEKNVFLFNLKNVEIKYFKLILKWLIKLQR